MSLPSGAVRLNWIQSSGTQWINTNYYAASQKLQIVADLTYTASNSNGVVFGGGVNNAWFPALYGNPPAVWVGSTGSLCQISVTTGTRFLLDVTASNGTLTLVKDGTKQTANYSGAISSSNPVSIFAQFANGRAEQFASVRVYMLQLYDNGLLVRDFIPVKLSDGSVGLWDDVEGKFYGNAGTGAFVAGPAAEIVELDWIESSGAQYADTGILGKSGLSAKSTFVVNSTGECMLLGCYGGARCYLLYFDSLQMFYGYLNSYPSGKFAITAGQKYSAEVSLAVGNQSIKIDGVTKVSSALTESYTTVQNLYLFAFNNSGSPALYASARLYDLQIYDNGLLVRDYIPAKTIEGEIGLYDRVFHEFYRNAGTGAFIAGPEAVKEPSTPANFRVVSESDTEVTLAWESSENAAGYRLYRNGTLLTDTAELTYTDNAPEYFTSNAYQLAAYNDFGESEPTALVMFRTPDNPILWLVTDRTQEDVTARNSKGVYRAQDLNRVGAAVDFLRGLLGSAGHTVNVFPRADWSALDWMNTEEAERYLADVSEIRRKLSVPASTPRTPDSMERMTFTKANHIEQILLDVYAQYLIMLTTRVAAGTATSGGDYL